MRRKPLDVTGTSNASDRDGFIFNTDVGNVAPIESHPTHHHADSFPYSPHPSYYAVYRGKGCGVKCEETFGRYWSLGCGEAYHPCRKRFLDEVVDAEEATRRTLHTARAFSHFAW